MTLSHYLIRNIERKGFMSISDNLTQQKLQEILLNLHEVGQNTKNMSVVEMIEIIKNQFTLENKLKEK